MKEDTRTEIDPKWNTVTLVRASCACCRTCWVFQRSGRCIHGGPFSGYVDSEGRPVAGQFKEGKTP